MLAKNPGSCLVVFLKVDKAALPIQMTLERTRDPMAKGH